MTNHEFSSNCVPPLAGETLIYTFITFRIDHCKYHSSGFDLQKHRYIHNAHLLTTPGTVNTLVPSFRSFSGSPSDPLRSPSSHQQLSFLPYFHCAQILSLFPFVSPGYSHGNRHGERCRLDGRAFTDVTLGNYPQSNELIKCFRRKNTGQVA